MPFRRLLFGALALGLLLPASLLPLPADAGEAERDAAGYRQVVDLTFPADPRVTYTDSYDAPRSGGRVHRATDLMGEKHWEVRAAVGGTITWIPGADGSPMPSYGYMITIAGDDGRSYSYVHLDNDTAGTDDGRGGPGRAYAPGLSKGSRVERGQLIGWLGDSGNAEGTAPHLHFEIADPDVVDPYGSHRIDPTPSLDAARARSDYGGARERDMGTAPGERACPGDRVPDAGFKDVTAGDPHRPGIDCSTWWKVATGTAPDRYEPARGLRRDEMADFVDRLFRESGAPLPEATTDHFDDDAASPHEGAINRLAAAGVVGGVAGRAYSPTTPVSRGQMASFLVRAHERITGEPMPAGRDTFADDDDSVHEANIDKVAGVGVAAGVTDDRFAPAEAVTRAQMATFLARVLDVLVADGHVASPPSAG